MSPENGKSHDTAQNVIAFERNISTRVSFFFKKIFRIGMKVSKTITNRQLLFFCFNTKFLVLLFVFLKNIIEKKLVGSVSPILVGG